MAGSSFDGVRSSSDKIVEEIQAMERQIDKLKALKLPFTLIHAVGRPLLLLIFSDRRERTIWRPSSLVSLFVFAYALQNANTIRDTGHTLLLPVSVTPLPGSPRFVIAHHVVPLPPLPVHQASITNCLAAAQILKRRDVLVLGV